MTAREQLWAARAEFLRAEQQPRETPLEARVELYQKWLEAVRRFRTEQP